MVASASVRALPAIRSSAGMNACRVIGSAVVSGMSCSSRGFGVWGHRVVVAPSHSP
jgi:hypothetical protein